MTDFEKNISASHQQLTPLQATYLDTNSLIGLKPDAIIIIGMGGSGLAGRILQTVALEINLPVPVIIWSDYGLPQHHFQKPLYIFVSFSGNTVETLSGFSEAPIGAKAVIATGGKLKELAQQTKTPLAIFPSGALQPRQATGLSFYALLGLLKIVFPDISVISLDAKLNGETNRAHGKALAEKLAKKIILIYTTSNNSALAYNWKDRLNETGKSLAFWNVIPELCHNEIVSFETKPTNLICLFLNDPADHPENKKRIAIVDQLLAQRNISSIHLSLSGETVFEKIFQSLNLADWTAWHLAQQQGVDAADIKIIDELKKLMK